MKKIRLDLNMLAVETFRTTGTPPDARGTVNAHIPPPPYTEVRECDTVECPGTGETECGTCAVSECGSCATVCYEDSYCASCVACATQCGDRTCYPYC
jgi:hypothetical protein